VTWELDTAAYLSGVSLIFLGRVSELAERLPLQIEEARARGNLYGETLLRMQCNWFVSLSHGDVAAARTDVGHATDEWLRGGVLVQNIAQMIHGAGIELYEANAEEAWRMVSSAWSRLEAALFLRIESVRVAAGDARGRVALAAAQVVTDPAERSRLMAVAHAQARALRGEAWPTARGQRLLLEAGILTAEDEREGAMRRLREAIAELDAQELALFAAAARYRLGELIGGPEGAALVTRVKLDMAELGVAEPEKMVRLYAPVRGVAKSR
jgi:hypothetical protein